MEIIVSLWTPSRTGVDPNLIVLFSCFFGSTSCPSLWPHPRPEPALPLGPLPPLLQTGEASSAGHQAEEAGCMEDQQVPDTPAL